MRRSIGLAHRRLQRRKQRRIRLRIPERAAFDVERRYALFGDEKTHRSLAGVELLANPFADGAAFLRCRAHQRHIGIVVVEQPRLPFRRHRLRRPEIDHVERADRADIRQPGAGNRAEAILGGGKHSAEQQVADLRRGDVEDARQQAGIGELLHRAAAGAGGVEHQAVVVALQAIDDLGHAGRGDAEHGEAERRLAVGADGRIVRHADDRLGCVRQDDAADAVQPGHVGDRRHHDDVGHADIRRHVARGERRDHELRQAERQLAHAGCHDRSAAAAADADDAGNIFLGGGEPREGSGHGGDCPSAVAGDERFLRAFRSVFGDFRRCHVRPDRRFVDADVDDDRRAARRLDPRGEIGEFLALRVGRSDDVDALHKFPPRPDAQRRPASLQAVARRLTKLLRFRETGVSY